MNLFFTRGLALKWRNVISFALVPYAPGREEGLVLDLVATYPDSSVNPRSVRYVEPSEPKPGFMQTGGSPLFSPAHLLVLVRWACND